MLRTFATLGLMLALCRPLCAEETNLNLGATLDGRAVTVSMVRFAGDDDLGYYRITVTGGDGAPVWSSPKVQKMGDPWCFSIGPGGGVDMQAVGDIDGDGAVELVVQEAQSDVRAPHFRILRWAHHGFSFVRSSALVETPAGSGHFVWRGGNVPTGTWIATFKSVQKGQVTALVNQYTTHMLAGEAVLAADARGYHVVRWEHKIYRSNKGRPVPQAGWSTHWAQNQTLCPLAKELGLCTIENYANAIEESSILGPPRPLFLLRWASQRQSRPEP